MTIEKQQISNEKLIKLPKEYLRLLVTFAAKHGISPSDILNDTGVSVISLARDSESVRLEAYHQGIENLLKLSNEPHLAWDYGLELCSLSHGMLGLVMRSSSSLLQMYETMSRFLGTQTASKLVLSTEATTEQFRALFWVTDKDLPEKVVKFSVISTVMSFAWVSRMLSNTEGKNLGETISFQWNKPTKSIPKKLIPPGAFLLFNCQINEISYPFPQANLPILSKSKDVRNAVIREFETQQGSSLSSASVADRISRTLALSDSGSTTAAQVAAKLNISPSTLKRKLSAEGTTYQELKNLERFSRAEKLLESSSLSLQKIAEAVGYDNASNFTKAYSRYRGESPQRFRTRNQMNQKN